MPDPFYFAENYDSMRLHAQLARGVFLLLDTTITSIEGPLITELRGSYGLEPILRTFKWLPWSSSMRVDLLDDVPQLIRALHRYCRATMECINTIEIYLFRLHDLVGEKFCAGTLNNREEIGEGLLNLSRYAGRGLMSSFLYPCQFVQQGGEIPVNYV